MNGIKNLWRDTGDKKTDDINIIKTYLTGASEGYWAVAEYVFQVNFSKIDLNKWEDSTFSTGHLFEDAVGCQEDYKLDTPELDRVAEMIYGNLKKLEQDVYEHPEAFFEPKDSKVYYCNAIEGIGCDHALFNESLMADICTNCKNCPFKTDKRNVI